MRHAEDLLREVNASGFPLQLGLARIVTDATASGNWTVRYIEHSGKVPSGESGFIDLVVELEERPGASSNRL